MSIQEVPTPDIKTEQMNVNEDTIQILEGYLKDAKEGNLTEIMLVGMHSETKLVKMSCSQTMSITEQLGALELAKANVLSHVIIGSYIQTEGDQD